MQQNIDISTNIEVKNTITESISLNTIAAINPFPPLDFSQSLLSYMYEKCHFGIR